MSAAQVDLDDVEEDALEWEDKVTKDACTREDLEQVMAVGLQPLYHYIERLENMVQKLVSNTELQPHGHAASPSEARLNRISSKEGEQVGRFEHKGRDKGKLDATKFQSDPGISRQSSPGDGEDEHVEQTPADSASASYDSQGAKEGGHGIKSQLKHGASGRSSVYDKDGDKKHSIAGDMVHSLVVHHEMQLIGGDECNSATKETLGVRILNGLLRTTEWWESIQEPERKGVLFRIVESSSFESLCAMTIVVNSIMVAFAADWEMKNLGQKPPELLNHMEIYFVIFYAVELFMRMFVHKLFFFVNAEMRWNIFDFTLVMVSIIDTILMSVMAAEGGNNMVFMRILRICKLAKILRAFRAMRFFKDLSIMLDSFKNSFVALWWSLVMMVFVLYVFALIFLQGLADYIVFEGDSLDTGYKSQVKELFGSMPLAMQSLYMAVTGGNDWVVYHKIVERSGGMYAGAWIFFTFFFTFALFNILTGIFVEKAVVAASPDRDDLVLQQRRKARQDAEEFRHMCKLLDEGATGYITWKDFERQMHNEVMVSYMASIGLEVHEVELFFRIVAGAAEQGQVSIDRFVDGCMQMKGSATGIDMQRQLFEVHLLHKDVKNFENHCLHVLHGCTKKVEALAAQLLQDKICAEPSQLLQANGGEPQSLALHPPPMSKHLPWVRLSI